jgi:hypothetical protein
MTGVVEVVVVMMVYYFFSAANVQTRASLPPSQRHASKGRSE